MAPHHHKALKPVALLRRELGFRTLFNLMGPLANPAGTKRQLVGVFDRKWVLPLAQVLQELGAEKAWVVHGSDGLDEITLTGDTYCAVLDNGKITERVISPADFGLPTIELGNILGGTALDNAAALKNLLAGAKSAYRDIVIANASAVLLVADQVANPAEGVAMAAKAIDDGSALAVLTNYTSFSKAA
jgi:anthranilate phosphoribosyltransferase